MDAHENVSGIEAIAFTFASYILEQEESVVEQDWLKRSVKEMYEALENTSLYQEVMQRVLKKGRIDTSRHNIQLFVQSRFPALSTLARERTEQIDDIELLDVMIVGIGSAHTEDEARDILQKSGATKAE